MPGPAAGGPEPLPASPTPRWHLLTWYLPQFFLCEEGAATLTAIRTLILDFPQETRGEGRLSQRKQFLSQAPTKLCSRSPPQDYSNLINGNDVCGAILLFTEAGE